MKKKWMALMMAVVLGSFVFAGCSSQTTEPESADTPEDTPEEATLQENIEIPGNGVIMNVGGEVGAPEGEVSMVEPMDGPPHIWGTVISTDESSMMVDNQSGISSPGEIILHIDPESTRVVDAETALPADLADIEANSAFEAYLGPAMSMSLPPQTTPLVVIVNVKEDVQAPVYVIAAALAEDDENLVLTADSGVTYQVPQDVEVVPYLTRNIVTLDDVAEGTECLIYLDEDGTAEKLVVFAS